MGTAFGSPGFATLHCRACELVVTPLDPDGCFDTPESEAQNNRGVSSGLAFLTTEFASD